MKKKKFKLPVAEQEKDVGGRPTKFKKQYCQAIVDFFSTPPNREVKVGNNEYELRVNNFPKFHEFADSIEVNGDTVVDWAAKENEKKYPGFSAAYKKAKELQKWFLIENTLAGLYNPTFSIFTAKNITDMKDEQKVKHGGDVDVHHHLSHGEALELFDKMEKSKHDKKPTPKSKKST